MSGNILIVGGAGYIGSHVGYYLNEKGYQVIVYDNLSEGHREAVVSGDFILGDISDSITLDKVFENNKIDAVMHFSAYAYVGESVENPEKYYRNNVSATINLLSIMLKSNVKRLIFSSSCATYGIPVYTPIDERHPRNPVNPYGATKVIVERILSDYATAYGLNYISLRYFNAAGAHPNGRIGESHRVETHLIPLVLKTLTGEKDSINIFGTDYDTPDGTCIRDYIHVCDLAAAHIAALEIILSNGDNDCVNLGTGSGISVREIISKCEQITGMVIPTTFSGRRPGDPASLIASNDYAKHKLDFIPKYDIDTIIKTAWEWERNRRY